MAEELSRYLQRIDIKTQYIHSDVDTLERIEILDNLREGAIDVLIGVNLLREGLDLPEVSLVAILDADKEGFLRSERSLTQTAGRAARNVNGKVIFYADKITQSMQKTMDETNRRREKQIAYNLKNNIYPQSIQRTRLSLKGESQQKKYEDNGNKNNQLVTEENHINYLSPKEINNLILSKQKAMEKAVKELNFMEAARLRDEINFLKNLRD
jgi:excinuclease ABC subunit B